MTSLSDVRQSFLEFFKAHAHEVLPSSPLVPHNDPTLMFTNAGMVQFKNFFTGAEKTPVPRAATSQKCVRAGGKHNDLDNVGYTARHHTFFEMLGNFSFGDYFKERAIELAWQYLTGALKLPKDKLTVTVYHTDDEAFKHWKKISGLPDERIIRIATNDNFWAMGPIGPCGPCSEIFYDHGPEIPGGPPGSPAADGDRFVEIWNLVFMQFEQLADGKQIALPKPSIDTGMGLERISAVMQGVHDNYEIDLFKNLIREIRSKADAALPKDGSMRSTMEAVYDRQQQLGYSGEDVAYKVIADHLRSSSFLIADGVLPSNEGRGYVLRRIMRRAMRYVHQLGVKEPLMYQLVPALIHEMGDHYPELKRAVSIITQTLQTEEERFKETLGRGLKILEEEVTHLKKGQHLSGEIAFKLYDTYGFPLDLTEDILRSHGIAIDQEGFDAAMRRQKEAARAAWVGSGESKTDPIWFEIRDRHGATEFLGYDLTEAQGKVVAIARDGKQVDQLSAGQDGQVITNQTPFYGESGGQMGDYGALISSTLKAVVLDTKKYAGDLHVHQVRVEKGAVKVEDSVTMTVDEERRTKIRANHSTTHLLHAVLRKHLGEHVTQKGSMVEEDGFRFDFSHPKALTEEESLAVENEVNQLIRQNAEVTTCLSTPQEAVQKGAMALFGEKYGSEVRVVTMGFRKPETGNLKPETYSVELCGGTHVKRTGDIGLFKITAESAVAAGIRRIEGVTGQGALDYIAQQEAALASIAQALKASPRETLIRVQSLMEERKKLERELAELRKSAALGGATKQVDAIEKIGNVSFIGKVIADLPPKDLRGIVDNFKEQIGSGVVAVISVVEGKAAICVGVTEDFITKFSAVSLIQAAVQVLGGKGGGGRPDMAQAGGPDGGKAEDAIQEIKKLLSAQ